MLCNTGVRLCAFSSALSLSVILLACSSGIDSDDDGDELPQGNSACETASSVASEVQVVAVPPTGQLYHGVFPGGHEEWGEEDDLTLQDVQSYEQVAGKSVAWVYFSHNWFRDHAFPEATVQWIRTSGSTPFIRLMLRSSAEQNLSEPTYTLQRIIDGDFDGDLCGWAQAARDNGGPLLVEFGTEVNGQWFSWNGVWNGGEQTGGYGDGSLADGPERFRDAYRHIVNLMQSQGAYNMLWVFHVDAQDVPEDDWNRFENYYPGDDWIDWVGVSVYGAAEPTDDEWIEFRQPMDDVYSRLVALTEKPIAVLEFGVTDGNPNGDRRVGPERL